MTLGKIERFWKTIREEFIAEALFASFADASQRIAHWIAYYNHQRPHQGIGGGRPVLRAGRGYRRGHAAGVQGKRVEACPGPGDEASPVSSG
jgi:transposase InsO family protein